MRLDHCDPADVCGDDEGAAPEPERQRVELRVLVPRVVHRRLVEVGAEVGHTPESIVREVITRWTLRRRTPHGR